MILKGFFYLISFIKDNQNLYRSRGTIFLLKKIKIDVIMRTIVVILGMKIISELTVTHNTDSPFKEIAVFYDLELLYNV